MKEDSTKDFEKLKDFCKTISKELLEKTNTLPAVKCNNPTKLIAFNIKTTGTNIENDEILQISIIDGNGEVLIDEYVKPYWTDEWDAAEKRHGIKPKDVINATFPHDLLPKIKGIFESTEILVAYDIKFNLQMLATWGIYPTEQQKQYDVMKEFEPIFNKWKLENGSHMRQTLTSCANYFNYKIVKTNGLEEAKATLHCYHELIKIKKEATSKIEFLDMLKTLSKKECDTLKVVFMRENNLSNEWHAFVCKTNAFADAGLSCNVNDIKLSEVFNALLEYGIKSEISNEFYQELEQNEIF